MIGHRPIAGEARSDCVVDDAPRAGAMGMGFRAARAIDHLFASIRSRKAYHLLGGGVATVCALMLDTPWFVALCAGWLALFGIIGRRISTAALGLLLLATLTGDRLTTFGAALVFVVGDGVATLAGTAFGELKLPWHDQKSVAGSLAFLAAATVAMMAALPALVDCSLLQLGLLAALPSLAGCIAESLPFALVRDIRDGQPDDNLLVLLSSGVVLHWLTRFLHIGAGP
jgi:hypothetical protein